MTDVVQTSNQRYLTLPTKVRRLSDKVASIWREKYKDTSMRTSLVSSILSGYEPNNDGYKLLRTSIDQLVALDGSFFRARVAWFKAANNNKISSRSSLIADYLISLEPKRRISSESYNTSISISEPWLRPSSNIGKKNQFYERLLREANVHIGPSAFTREELIFADWSPIYYSCELRKWLMSFSTLIIGEVAQNVYTIRGLISVDIDVTNTDFNQCNSDVFTSINKVSLSSNTGNSAATGTTGGDQQAVTGTSVLVNLPGSHKCEETSSLVSIYALANTASLFSSLFFASCIHCVPAGHSCCFLFLFTSTLLTRPMVYFFFLFSFLSFSSLNFVCRQAPGAEYTSCLACGSWSKGQRHSRVP